MWDLCKYNGVVGYVYGEPARHALINKQGIFVFASRTGQWLPISSHHWVAPLFEAERLSRLEALVLFGLHDGNAEEIGKDAVPKVW